MRRLRSHSQRLVGYAVLASVTELRLETLKRRLARLAGRQRLGHPVDSVRDVFLRLLPHVRSESRRLHRCARAVTG